MKKLALTLALTSTMIAQAQIVNVTSIEPLAIEPNDEQVVQAVAISPAGDYLLLSTDAKQGLTKWDFATRTLTTVTQDAGAGSDVRISDDGLQIIYSEVSYKDKRRQQAVKSVDMTTGKKQTLVKATRNQQGFAIENGTAATMTDGKLKFHALKKGADLNMTRPVLSRHHLKLYITRNGVTTMLAPNGPDERYIWGSLSPDGQRVLYYVSGHGAFICDVDGTHVVSMGNITAPKWWDNNTIVGMNETGNEYSAITSSIVLRTMDGVQQTLTGDDIIATYPQPSPQSGKIAFSTPEGKIFLITVE